MLIRHPAFQKGSMEGSMDSLNSLVIGIMATLIGSWLIAIMRRKDWLRKTFSEWNRRGITVIYIAIPCDAKTTSLWLYLCGEEESLLFPDTKDRNSHFLAMKPIDYLPNGCRDEIMAKWERMLVKPLCDWIKEHPNHLVQLVRESQVLLTFNVTDNDETVIVHDSFKFKDELDECLKKYKVKYCKRETEARNRWEIEPRYPT